MILHCSSMSGMQTNMFVHIFTYCHIINPSLIPHWHTTNSLYNCARCLPNPSPTPIQVQLKPCPTHASTKGPMQTNQRPKQPGARQSKQTTTMTMRTSQVTNKKQQMGWRTRTTPQHREAVDEGMPWKKVPLEGSSGTIIVECTLISSFFFFFFLFSQLLTVFLQENCPWSGSRRCGTVPTKVCPYFFSFFNYLVFTGKPPIIRLAMRGNCPHKGKPGMVVMIMPYIFFFFSNTYCLFTGKLPTFRLMMTWNRPHKGTPGTIITIVPFFLFFFWILTGRLPTFRLTMTWNRPHRGMPGMIVMIVPFFLFSFFFFEYLLFFTGNCPCSGSRWHGTVPTKVHWAWLLRSCPFFFFSFFEFLLFFYRKTTRDRTRDDVELSPPRYARHDCYDRALFLYFFLFFLNTDLFLFFYRRIFYRRTTCNQAHNDRERSPPAKLTQ